MSVVYERMKFQFQNGSINRRMTLGIRSPIRSFNSKMVRLIVSPCQIVGLPQFVSIPKWFD